MHRPWASRIECFDVAAAAATILRHSNGQLVALLVRMRISAVNYLRGRESLTDNIFVSYPGTGEIPLKPHEFPLHVRGSQVPGESNGLFYTVSVDVTTAYEVNEINSTHIPGLLSPFFDSSSLEGSAFYFCFPQFFVVVHY